MLKEFEQKGGEAISLSSIALIYFNFRNKMLMHSYHNTNMTLQYRC